MQQWRDYALNYRDRAGLDIAERFIGEVDDALSFIRQTTYACSVYDAGEEVEDLRAFQFRKAHLHHFPHMVLFRLGDEATVFVEVLYADKMDIPSRLTADIGE